MLSRAKICFSISFISSSLLSFDIKATIVTSFSIDSVKVLTLYESTIDTATTINVIVIHDIEIVKQMNKRVILLNSGRVVKDYEEGTYK